MFPIFPTDLWRFFFYSVSHRRLAGETSSVSGRAIRPAIMLTLAANQVVMGKKSPDYWDVERRWIAGEYRSIVAQKMTSLKNKMKL